MTPPRQLSMELRYGKSPNLQRRRWIIGLSMLGLLMGRIVSLYQIGMLRKLPDPPLRIFDSARVDASNYAYKRFDTPDAFLMMITYSVTASLAAAGGLRRASRQPLIPIAMGVKIAFDVATALKLAAEEWDENKALCAYCQVATAASVVSLVLALPEVAEAVGNLGKDRDTSPVALALQRVAERAGAETLRAVP